MCSVLEPGLDDQALLPQVLVSSQPEVELILGLFTVLYEGAQGYRFPGSIPHGEAPLPHEIAALYQGELQHVLYVLAEEPESLQPVRVLLPEDEDPVTYHLALHAYVGVRRDTAVHVLLGHDVVCQVALLVNHAVEQFLALLRGLGDLPPEVGRMHGRSLGDGSHEICGPGAAHGLAAGEDGHIEAARLHLHHEPALADVPVDHVLDVEFVILPGRVVEELREGDLRLFGGHPDAPRLQQVRGLDQVQFQAAPAQGVTVIAPVVDLAAFLLVPDDHRVVPELSRHRLLVPILRIY